jgi:hypothetical protein
MYIKVLSPFLLNLAAYPDLSREPGGPHHSSSRLRTAVGSRADHLQILALHILQLHCEQSTWKIRTAVQFRCARRCPAPRRRIKGERRIPRRESRGEELVPEEQAHIPRLALGGKRSYETSGMWLMGRTSFMTLRRTTGNIPSRSAALRLSLVEIDVRDRSR